MHYARVHTCMCHVCVHVIRYACDWMYACDWRYACDWMYACDWRYACDWVYAYVRKYVQVSIMYEMCYFQLFEIWITCALDGCLSMIAAVSILIFCHSWAISNASKWRHKLWNTKGMTSLLKVKRIIFITLYCCMYVCA